MDGHEDGYGYTIEPGSLHETLAWNARHLREQNNKSTHPANNSSTITETNNENKEQTMADDIAVSTQPRINAEAQVLAFPKFSICVGKKDLMLAGIEIHEFAEHAAEGNVGGLFGWETELRARSPLFWRRWVSLRLEPFRKKVDEGWSMSAEDTANLNKMREVLTFIFCPIYARYGDRIPPFTSKMLIEKKVMLRAEGPLSYEREIFSFMLGISGEWCREFGNMVNGCFPDKRSECRYLIFVMASMLFDALRVICKKPH